MLAFVVAFMFVALSTRLWFLQVLAGPQHERDARDNSLRTVTTDALRGDILDRDGRRLVHNRLSLEVRINRDELGDEAEATLAHLSEILGVPAQELGEALDSKLYYSYQPVPVAEFVPEEVFFKVREEPERFPGVEVVEQSVRAYPQGQLARPPRRMGRADQRRGDRRSAVRRVRAVGPRRARPGLEATYERWLRGTPGEERFLVNSDGEVLREFDPKPAEPGHDLRLSLGPRRPEDRRGGAPRGHRERADGLRRELGEEPRRERRRRRRARSEDGRHRRDGVVADLSPRRGSCGGSRRPSASCCSRARRRRCSTAPRRSPTRPDRRSSRSLRSRRSKEGIASFGGTTTARPSTCTRATSPARSSTTGTVRAAACLSIAEWSQGLVRHAVLRSSGAISTSATRTRTRRSSSARVRQWGFGRQTGVDLPAEAVGTVPDHAYVAEHPEVYPDGWIPGDRHPARDRLGGDEGDAVAARAGVLGAREREALPAASRRQRSRTATGGW